MPAALQDAELARRVRLVEIERRLEVTDAQLAVREQRDDAQPRLVAERAKQPRQRADAEVVRRWTTRHPYITISACTRACCSCASRTRRDRRWPRASRARCSAAGRASRAPGSQPSRVNPNAIAVMREVGDRHRRPPQQVGRRDRSGVGRRGDHAVRRGGLPDVAGQLARLHWPIPDPATSDPSVHARGAARAVSHGARRAARVGSWAFAATNVPDGRRARARRPATIATAIEALVRASELPTEVVRDQFPAAYVVARRDGAVVGVAGARALTATRPPALGRRRAAERGRGLGLALVAESARGGPRRGSRRGLPADDDGRDVLRALRVRAGRARRRARRRCGDRPSSRRCARRRRPAWRSRS